MMILKKWFIAFVLCLVTFVVSAENQEEVVSPLSQATSFQAIVEMAERGDAEAQDKLGLMYLNGKGVTQNDIEAAKWFRKAAEQGHADAQNELGVMYDNGIGVTQNDIEAAKWFRKAAEQGQAGAYGNLGWILITQGKFDEAQSVTEKAHQKQPLVFSWSMNLGHIYLLKGDRQTARRYYQEALPLIQDDASFERGPIADFGWFIEKGWQVKACRSELDWIRSAFEQLKLAKTYDDQIGQYYQQGRFEQALPLAEKALKIRTEILGEKHPDTLTSLMNLANIYQNSGRLEEALPLFEKGYRLKKELLGEKHPETLTILNSLAVIYQAIGRLDETLPLYENGYRLSKELLGEKHPSMLTSLNNLAAIYYDLNRLEEALPLYENGYRLSKELLGEKHPQTLSSMNNLAMIYQGLGRLSDALPLFEKGYHLSKETLGEKHPSMLTSLNNLAAIYQAIGRLDEALPLYENGYRLNKELLGEKHPQTISSMNNLAGIYQELGRLNEASPLFENSYRLFKEVGEKHPSILTTLSSLILIYQALGRLDDILPWYENAYHLSKEVYGEKHPNTLTILNNLVFIYQAVGSLDKALPLSENSYSLCKEILGEKHPTTLLSLNNLVRIYTVENRLDNAVSLSENSYHLCKEVLGEKHPTTLISLNNLARIYQALSRLDEALPLYENSYRLHKEVLGEKHSHTLLSLSNLAYTYLEQGNINKAIEHLETFMAGVENLRRGDLSAENRQTLFKQWVPGYFLLGRLYIDQSRPFDALRLAEMSKARTLLESLAAKLAAYSSGLTTAEQQKLRDYETRLARSTNRIAKALEDNRLDEKISLETDKNQLVSQFNQFHRELMAKYPKYAQFSKVQIIGAKKGAKYLPADAVLISYLVNNNHVLTFTLQADGVLTAHDLGKIPKLEKNLETYRRLLSSGNPEQEKSASSFHESKPIRLNKRPTIQSLSRQLGKQLLEPLKDIIKDKPHWIISPNGSLALIPFETLRLENQPVIAQHQISYVQSLSVLKMLQERNKVYNSLENRGTLLAMGAPIYENATTSCPKRSKVHPNTVDFNIAHALVHRSYDPQRYTHAFRQLDQKWCNLAGAKRELEQLEKLFEKTKPRIYKQADATEAKLQELNQQSVLAQYRYLVFSAHGYLSPQVPALSSIVLGQVNNPPGIDGYVTAGEWPGYDLKSDLMVLSACETGLGEVVGGEGVMGLPYAFYVAGNKNTILTLWKISDEITTEFTTSFFAKLKAGVGQIEALTATKREFLKKGGIYSNPKYWAAFVLYGV